MVGAAMFPSHAASAAGAYKTVTRPLMGTLFKITCYSQDRERIDAASEAAFAIAGKINSVASDYIADSELLSFSKLPHGKPHPVSETLFPLLLEALKYAKQTQGNFDSTLGPLTKLWRQSRRRGELPPKEKLKAALAASGYEKLILNEANRTLTFTRPGMRLDLGGIAKGQTADAMLEVFKQHGLPMTSITCGGDVRVGDPPPGAKHWNVAVVTGNTKEKSTPPLKLVNQAVSTSGDLHQFIEIDGTRYSHIIDPRTGLGLTEPKTATVIAPTAAESDALATAGCVA